MHVTVEQQGNRLTVKVRSDYSSALLSSKVPKTYSVRGKITHFSRKSRKRLIDLFASFDAKKRQARKPLFITMTYQKNMQDYQRAKRDLKVFVQRLRYHYPGCAGVWRMELQGRGAIHFHLMLFGVGFLPAQTWQDYYNEITGETANNSLDVQAIRSFRGTMFYAAKYMAKEDAPPQGSDTEAVDLPIRHTRRKQGSVGRMWGYWNKANLPLGKRRYAEKHLSRAAMSKWLDVINNPHTKLTYSFTVYADDANDFFADFESIGSDPFTMDVQARVSGGKAALRGSRRRRLLLLHEVASERRISQTDRFGYYLSP
jgi:hypothetical protein